MWPLVQVSVIMALVLALVSVSELRYPTRCEACRRLIRDGEPALRLAVGWRRYLYCRPGCEPGGRR